MQGPLGWQVLQRGWLSSNSVVLHGHAGEGAVLIDSGHSVHAAQTEALVRHALQGQTLRQVVNTHLHADHCGGNARLQANLGAEVAIPASQLSAVQQWDTQALSYAPTGQHCERFSAQRGLHAGDLLSAGSHQWRAVAAPGHEPHTLMYFNESEGVLLSADALWENGFGVVFPELEGQAAFQAVRASLTLIEQLAPRFVIPGHGQPFQTVALALARAHARLHAFEADPRRHARHASKAFLKFHQMEVDSQPENVTLQWLQNTPVMQACWRQESTALTLAVWAQALIDTACQQGLIQRRDGWLLDLPLPG